MSLLMQALKKAERAKQNAVADEELDKPSEAFDELLALTPTPAPAPEHEFSLEPMEGMSLEPLAPPVAAAPTPRPSPDPAPAASDHREPGLTLDLSPDPAAPPPAAPTPAPAPAAARPESAPRPAAASGRPSASAGAPPPEQHHAPERPRAAARAHARAAAQAAPSGIDPERLRLFALIGVLLLVVGGFGLYYWRALNGPGAGAGLPPVPMPPAGASGATPAQAVVAAVSPGEPPAGAAAADDPMLASTANGASAQELERRLARTEQELASVRQAATPAREQLPVLKAPENDDIRIARVIQPAPVSPTLEGAYQAFNGGDFSNAQQQYAAALRQEPNNRDALLGMAAASARLNQKDKAASYYLQLLELSPNDDAATAGLIGLRQGDISQSEARLKAILAGNPDAAPVLFALGNLYAQQGRWPDAQQAYFRAVGAAPDNPDYVYNLAIGLDRLNQPRLALTYYQRALALAQDRAVGFDRAALRQRLHELNTAR